VAAQRIARVLERGRRSCLRLRLSRFRPTGPQTLLPASWPRTASPGPLPWVQRFPRPLVAAPHRFESRCYPRDVHSNGSGASTHPITLVTCFATVAWTWHPAIAEILQRIAQRSNGRFQQFVQAFNRPNIQLTVQYQGTLLRSMGERLAQPGHPLLRLLPLDATNHACQRVAHVLERGRVNRRRLRLSRFRPTGPKNLLSASRPRTTPPDPLPRVQRFPRPLVAEPHRFKNRCYPLS